MINYVVIYIGTGNPLKTYYQEINTTRLTTWKETLGYIVKNEFWGLGCAEMQAGRPIKITLQSLWELSQQFWKRQKRKFIWKSRFRHSYKINFRYFKIFFCCFFCFVFVFHLQKILEQHCPTGLSASVKMFYICAVQYGNHQPQAASENLKLNFKLC